MKSLEPFKQRINMNYTFTGFDEKEVKESVSYTHLDVYKRQPLDDISTLLPFKS